MQRSLQRAILHRQEVSDWHSKNQRSAEDERLTNTHKFFTSVLVRIRESLRPHFELQAELLPHATVSTFKQDSTPENTKANATRMAEADSKSEIPSASEDTCTTVYEFDNSKNEDTLVKLWSLFDTGGRYTEFLIKLWTMYVEKTLSLKTVATVTKLVFQMIKKSEDNLIATAPELFDGAGEHSYRAIHDFLCKKFLMTDSMKKAMYLYEALFLVRTYGMSSHTAMSCERLSTKVESNLYNKGQEENEEFIAKMMLDLNHYRLLYENPSFLQEVSIKQMSPYLDPVTASLTQMAGRGVSFAAIHAAHSLLEIWKLLGDDIKVAYLQLRQAGAEAKHTLSTSIDWKRLIFELKRNAVKKETMPLWHAQNAMEVAATTVGYIRYGIEENIVASTRQSLANCPSHASDAQCKCCDGTAEERQPGRIWSSKDTTFYNDHNPVYCGLESVRLMLTMEKAGIALLDGEALVSITCHLYNAVKQNNNGTKLSWPTLEALMEDFKSELFMGSYPTTPDTIMKRFYLCGGAKASVFSPTVRASELEKLQKLRFHCIFKQSDLSLCLERFLEDNATAEELLHAARITRSKKVTRPVINGRDSMETLLDFAKDLEAALPSISHNYIKIREQCCILFQEIRKVLETDLEDDIIFANYLIQRACGVDVFASEPSRKNKSVPAEKELMKTLVTVFESFLKRISNQDTVAPFSIESVSSFVNPRMTARAARKRNQS